MAGNHERNYRGEKKKGDWLVPLLVAGLIAIGAVGFTVAIQPAHAEDAPAGVVEPAAVESAAGTDSAASVDSEANGDPATTPATTIGEGSSSSSASESAKESAAKLTTYGGIGQEQLGRFEFPAGSKVVLLDPKTSKEAKSPLSTKEGTYKLKLSKGTNAKGEEIVIAEASFTPAKDFVGNAAPVTLQAGEAAPVLRATFAPIVRDNQRTVEKTQTIRFAYEDGSAAATDVTRSATWEYVGEVNPATGDIAWPAASVATLAAVEAPAIEGFEPSPAGIAETQATPEAWPADATITYAAAPDASAASATLPTEETQTSQEVTTFTTTETTGNVQASLFSTSTLANVNTALGATDETGEGEGDGTVAETDTVTTTGADKAPTKSVSTGGALIARSSSFVYTIQQVVSQDATSLIIIDDLEGVLEFVSSADQVNVSYGGMQVSAYVYINGQRLTVEIQDATELRGGTVSVSFEARVRNDVSLSQYTSANIANIPNTAQSIFNGDASRTKNSNTTHVRISLGGTTGAGTTTVGSTSTITRPTSATATGKLPATGDSTPIFLAAVLALGATSLLGVAALRRFRSRDAQ